MVSVLLVVASGLAAAAVGSRAPWAWAAVGVVPALPGVIWPIWFEFGIRAWNKGARLTAAALRGYVLRIGYYLLFAAVGRTGSSLQLLRAQNEASRWIARDRHDPTVADHGPLPAGAGNSGWGQGVVEMLRSSGGAGRAWTICLMPVLLLLLLLRDEEQEHQPPSSTYTLY
jgi:hypothetical protein